VQLVAGEGLEPSSPCERLILSQMRLPVSPPRPIVAPTPSIIANSTFHHDATPRRSVSCRECYFCCMGINLDKAAVMTTLKTAGLVPVLRADSIDQALALASAISEGGVNVLEVTMTVPGALQVIRRLTHERPDILIGAGTVLDPETARICILEGARFVVSPALNLKTIETCHRYSVAVLPGALTPTEILTAWEAGADAVKVFPASAIGGAKYLASLKGPLHHIHLIPTGGVSLSTAADFLQAGAFALGVGTDLVDTKAMAAGRPEVITDTARRYLAIVQEFQQRSAASA
jgi:2-dehydro-3-deoxyphosphogluconate aldolase/(4S)-4-hydroxy-2-oxoglutarate aldolase